MSGQLAIGRIDLGRDRARLSCGHDVELERETAPRLVDDWYAAVSCPVCRKRSAVVYVAFGTPSDRK